MSEVVNLRRARKAKLRAAEEARAAENRVLHGRTKEERRQAAAESELAARRVEGHRRELAPGPDPDRPPPDPKTR